MKLVLKRNWLSISTINEISLFILIAIYSIPSLSSLNRWFIPFSLIIVWILTSLLLEKRWISNFIGLLFYESLFIMGLLIIYASNPNGFDTSNTLFYILFFFWPFAYEFYSIRALHIQKRIIKVSLFFFFVGMFFTYRGLMIYPEAARTLANTSRDYATYYTSLGIGGYGFIYGLVFLTGVVFFLILNNKFVKKINKLYIYTFFLLQVLVVVKANYTIALMFLALNIFLVLIAFNSKNPIITSFFLVFIMTVLYVFKIQVADVFVYLARTLNMQTPQLKLLELKNVLFAQNIYDLERFQRYFISLETFLNSPILGSRGENNFLVGGHSEILDHLAKYGISGFLFLATILKSFKLQRIKIINRNQKLILLLVQLSFIMFAMINTFIIGYPIMMVVFFLNPLIFSAIDKERENQKK